MNQCLRLGRTESGVVEEAQQVLEQKTFVSEVDEAYTRLRADEAAWKEYLDETAAWDRLAGDGLPPNEAW
jgi:hypothetical protein